jgi:hypothetical protein
MTDFHLTAYECYINGVRWRFERMDDLSEPAPPLAKRPPSTNAETRNRRTSR